MMFISIREEPYLVGRITTLIVSGWVGDIQSALISIVGAAGTT
jgi:hypothetical protein